MKKPKLWYRDRHTSLCFIVNIKIDVYKDIAEDVETRFDTLNYELIDHCLKEKIKKWLD